MFMKVENLSIKSQSKKGFEKGDMHVVMLQLSQQPLCHQFLHSNPS